jgi:hypothetical protein
MELDPRQDQKLILLLVIIIDHGNDWDPIWRVQVRPSRTEERILTTPASLKNQDDPTGLEEFAQTIDDQEGDLRLVNLFGRIPEPEGLLRSGIPEWVGKQG